MKLPIMMKKYFDAYTLYVGQNTLQIFANFEDDPPITSSRLSSVTSSRSFSDDEEESDTDSGVGRASPIQHDNPENRDEEQNGTENQDDEFTVLWYGTDDSGDLDDISKVEGIFPDIQTEDRSDEDPDDISEEEAEDAPPYYATDSEEEEEEIFPGLPTRTHQGIDYSTTDSEDEEEGIFCLLYTSDAADE